MLNPDLFFVIDMINELQKDWAINTLEKIEEDRKIGKIAIMGVAFKPNTDDIRDSPSLRTIEYLYAMGYDIIVHDPKAIENFNKQYPHITSTTSVMEALQGADVAMFLTAWNEYKEIDMERFRFSMKDNPIVIDGRRMFDKHWISASGIDYYGVGYNKR
jgi:UDPglucose 6-dehydrogenase